MILLISENLPIVRFTTGFLECFSIFPEPRYFIKSSIKLRSLSCWYILNLNVTYFFTLGFSDFLKLTSKLPSAEVNPEIQLGSKILLVIIINSLLVI